VSSSRACSVVSLLDALWWGDDGGKGPVVERGEADPADHDRCGERPSDHVAHAVGVGLSNEFPEGGEVHN
jgi:hypothetical protein